MNMTETDMHTENNIPLLFTDNAASKVKQLIEEEGNKNLNLRVFVSGGGCSGFQYGLLLMSWSTKMIPLWKEWCQTIG